MPITRTLSPAAVHHETKCISKFSSLYEVFPELAGNGGVHGAHYAVEKWVTVPREKIGYRIYLGDSTGAARCLISPGACTSVYIRPSSPVRAWLHAATAVLALSAQSFHSPHHTRPSFYQQLAGAPYARSLCQDPTQPSSLPPPWPSSLPASLAPVATSSSPLSLPPKISSCTAGCIWPPQVACEVATCGGSCCCKCGCC